MRNQELALRVLSYFCRTKSLWHLRGIFRGKRLNDIEFLPASLGRFRQGLRQFAILKQRTHTVAHYIEYCFNAKIVRNSLTCLRYPAEVQQIYTFRYSLRFLRCGGNCSTVEQRYQKFVASVFKSRLRQTILTHHSTNGRDSGHRTHLCVPCRDNNFKFAKVRRFFPFLNASRELIRSLWSKSNSNRRSTFPPSFSAYLQGQCYDRAADSCTSMYRRW